LIERTIRLVALAKAVDIPHRTLVRWHVDRLVGGTNYGRGLGNGIRFTDAEAIEVAALVALRKHGVSHQALVAISQQLRRAGKAGADFVALGTDGRAALLDGAGDHLPLVNPKTRQSVMFVRLDLRPMRPAIRHLVANLAREERVRLNAREAKHAAA